MRAAAAAVIDPIRAGVQVSPPLWAFRTIYAFCGDRQPCIIGAGTLIGSFSDTV